MTDQTRVVVTGLGVAAPLGVGIASFWDALVQCRNAVGPIKAFDASSIPARLGGEVPALKPADYVPKNYRKSVKLMSRDIELAVAAAFEAAKDARLPTQCLVARGELDGPAVDPTRFGVNIGAGLICPDLAELAQAFSTALDNQHNFDLKRWGAEGMNNLTPLWLLKFLPNMLACHVTIVHDAQAISNTITCGEASGLLAVGEAYRSIARGAMDVCICGGAECKTNPMGVVRASLMEHAASDGQDDPASACKPFAADRRGTVMAEGGGLVVLESLDHAKHRNARIYAEITGFGAAGNTTDWRQPDPAGAGIALAIRNAMKDAGVAPADIDLVGTFGCGTRAHDASEIQAWKTALGDRCRDVAAFAVKGGMGVAGAGASSIDLCTAVMSLYNNTIPPSANTAPPDPECSLTFAADPLDRRIETAVTTGFALYGGQNAALVIRKPAE